MKVARYIKGEFLFYLFITLILCLIDGTMTIFLVERGAWEANPLMRYALAKSHVFFLLLKYFLTAVGIMFLLFKGHIRIFNRFFSLKEIAGGFILFYQGLVIYEINIYHIMK
jgi:hypothetical protein